MRTIYLVRHGVAADAAPGTKDADRPLTKQGVEKMEAAARGWQRLASIPTAIVTSPLLRARQTARVMNDVWRLASPPLDCDALAPGGALEELFKCIGRIAPRGDVACVGHMPDLVRLLGEMTNAGAGFYAELGKGSVSTVQFVGTFRPGAGTLRSVIPNRVLRRID